MITDNSKYIKYDGLQLVQALQLLRTKHTNYHGLQLVQTFQLPRTILNISNAMDFSYHISSNFERTILNTSNTRVFS